MGEKITRARGHECSKKTRHASTQKAIIHVERILYAKIRCLHSERTSDVVPITSTCDRTHLSSGIPIPTRQDKCISCVITNQDLLLNSISTAHRLTSPQCKYFGNSKLDATIYDCLKGIYFYIVTIGKLKVEFIGKLYVIIKNVLFTKF